MTSSGRGGGAPGKDPQGGWRWFNPRSLRGLGLALLLLLVAALFALGGPQLGPQAEPAPGAAPAAPA